MSHEKQKCTREWHIVKKTQRWAKFTQKYVNKFA